jgi:nucleoside-diphosphate-sugar epimerase
MKCLVTGAAGLIGHELCNQLYQQGHEIWALDNNFRGQAVPKCHNWLSGDLTALLPTLDNDFDYIYHMAAINGTSYFYKIPNELLKNNVYCDLELFEWAKNSVTLKSLVYGSSSEIVSGSGNRVTAEELDISVKNLHNPRWSYRLAKMVGENYLSNSKLPWVVIRYYNVYGHNSKAGHFVYDQIKNIKQDVYQLIGGEETRSFCLVEDAVWATIKVAEQYNKILINIGSDEEIRILDAAEIIARHLGKQKCQWNMLPGRSGSTLTRVPDISRLRSLIENYAPMSFDNGIKKIIQGFQC